MKKGIILKSILLAYMMVSVTNLRGQSTWVYSYGNAGNRTQRVVSSGSRVRQPKTIKPNNLLKDEKVSAIIVDSRNSINVEVLGLTSMDVAVPQLPLIMTAQRQAAIARAVGKRNEIESSVGTGKRVYQANDLRAKHPETAECWTGMCYFAKNVLKFFRELRHNLIELLIFLTLMTDWRAGLRPICLMVVN